jgi:SAM-dependent methyltransferase
VHRRHPEPYEEPELYDRLFAGLEHDLGFYVGLAATSGGPVLDLCCGTGRSLLPMLGAGVDAEGIDLVPRMLERLRAKADALGLAARVTAQDMRSFELPQRFRLIVITFNAFAHCLSTDAQLATLRRCADHLEPGGRLALDAMHGVPALLSVQPGTRVLELATTDEKTGRGLRLFDERTTDWLAQTLHSSIEVEEFDATGAVERVHRFATRTRWVQRSELELLVRAAGFRELEVFGGFDRSPVTSSSSQLVVLAAK